MKKLRILRIAMIGLLLAGAVALAGCSRYNTAHESQGKGRGSEWAVRDPDQGGRGRYSTDGIQELRDSGGYGRQQASREFSGDRFGAEQFGRQGTGNAQAGGQRGGQLVQRGAGGPEQSGKSVVDVGTLGNVSGTLSYDGSEWYLNTEKDTYMLHFGNSAYMELTGIDLREGEQIDIRGFISSEEIAVAQARIDAQVYTFRNEEGMPLWAGSGRRDNQVVRPYGGVGSAYGRPHGQGNGSGQGGQGRGQGLGSDGQSLERRGPGSMDEQFEGRGRGGELDGSDVLPWWYQQPLESEGLQSPA
jgi:hypothetical protein